MEFTSLKDKFEFTISRQAESTRNDLASKITVDTSIFGFENTIFLNKFRNGDGPIAYISTYHLRYSGDISSSSLLCFSLIYISNISICSRDVFASFKRQQIVKSLSGNLIIIVLSFFLS